MPEKGSASLGDTRLTGVITHQIMHMNSGWRYY